MLIPRFRGLLFGPQGTTVDFSRKWNTLRLHISVRPRETQSGFLDLLCETGFLGLWGIFLAALRSQSQTMSSINYTLPSKLPGSPRVRQLCNMRTQYRRSGGGYRASFILPCRERSSSYGLHESPCDRAPTQTQFRYHVPPSPGRYGAFACLACLGKHQSDLRSRASCGDHPNASESLPWRHARIHSHPHCPHRARNPHLYRHRCEGCIIRV